MFIQAIKPMVRSLLKATIVIGFIAILTACTNEHPKREENPIVIKNPTYGKWQNNPASPLSFDQTLTIGNRKDIILPRKLSITGPVVDDQGNIYFIDTKRGIMYSFDPEGNIRWKEGGAGNKTQKFNSAQGLAIGHNHLYVGMANGSRLNILNLKGHVINRVSLKRFGLTFTSIESTIKDSLLIVKSPVFGKVGSKITVLNVSGQPNEVSQFKIIFGKSSSEGVSIGVSLQVVDSLIAAGNDKKYTVRLYNIYGKHLKTIKRDFNKLSPEGIYKMGKGIRVCIYGNFNTFVDLNNGYYLATLSWPVNIKDPDLACKEKKAAVLKNSIDLYNSRGILLYSLESMGKFPNIGEIAYVDNNGNIYTKTNDPFPQIRRYRPVITAPEEQ